MSSCKPAAVRESRTVAVLLAGGRGTRLHELTATECKPAVHFAGQLRIVDFVIDNVVRAGIPQLLVCTQYRPATLNRHLDTAWRPAFGDGGLMLCDGPSVTGNKTGYDGTADAVAANIATIDAMEPGHVIVLAGDHVYAMDYQAMIAAHVAARAEATVAVEVVSLSKASAFGVLNVAGDGRVLGFEEKPAVPQPIPGDPANAMISMGIYVFAWSWLRAALLADRADPLSRHDFGSDILPAAVRKGVVHAWRQPLSPAATSPYWRDVGTLDAYLDAQIDFATPFPPVALPRPPGRSMVAGTSPGLVVGAGRRFVGTTGHWNLMDRSAILPGAHLGTSVKISRCVVAPGAVLPPGLVVGEDAAEDAKWFRRTEAGTTLITAEMLGRRDTELGQPGLVRIRRISNSC